MKTISVLQKVVALSTLVILLSVNIYAQENYLSGIIIKNDDVAIKGFIDYGNWSNNPNKINFKQKLSGKATSYSPIDISKFKVNDEIYVSAIIDSKISTNRVDRIKLNQILETQVDTTFLLAIIEGEKSLYHYKNKVEVDNFYIKKGNDFELLTYWKYLKKGEQIGALPDNKIYTAEQKKYIGQLVLYLNDCEKIQSKINKTTYTLSSLKTLFEGYYNCTDANASFSKNTDKYLLKFGTLAGLSYSAMKFETTPEFADGFDYDDFGSSINFSAGLYFDYTLPRNFNKWSISNDLLLSSFNISRSSEHFKSENNYTRSTGKLKFSYFKLFSTIKYKHSISESLEVYAKAGITNGLAFKTIEEYTTERKFYTTENTTDGSTKEGFRAYEQGLTVSLGAVYNKYRIELKYERGNGIFNKLYVNSTSSRVYLLFGYSLFQKN